MPADKELTGPERAVLRAVGTGRLVDLDPGRPGSSDPAQGAEWAADRRVRAELLVELLTGQRTSPDGVQARALRLRGARITGRLDLASAALRCAMDLRDCSFQEPIRLRDAQAPAIALTGCHVPGLDAALLETRGSLALDHGFTALGEVDLLGARIAGQLYCDGAHLSNPDGVALNADELVVNLSMFCRDVTARGEVRLPGARVGGELTFEGASLVSRNGWALTADRLRVGGDMFCGTARIRSPEPFRAIGEVALPGAHIEGQLSFTGARLENPGGPALAADDLVVGGSVYVGGGFTARGEVRLFGARVGGQLYFMGASLAGGGPGRRALDAYRLTVEHDVTCVDLRAEGEVRLAGARIGGRLRFADSSLASGSGYSLDADQLGAGSLSFGEGFAAKGPVRLQGVSVAGQLDFSGVCGRRCPDAGQVALNLQEARVATLFLTPSQPLAGAVDLVGARVGILVDDQRGWPTPMRLRGFVYETLQSKIPLRERLRWLERDPDGYSPQPYEQLAATYLSAGQEEDARRVAIAKQRRRGRMLNPFARAWSWLLWATVGFGYRTWQAGVWLLALLVAGTLVFDRAYPAQMVPTRQPAPAFHAPAYALDVLVPIVNLGQQDAWLPRGAALPWSWVLIAAGWILTTAVVAGLTSILKRA